MSDIPKNQIIQDFEPAQKAARQRVSDGVSQWSLGLAKVVTVNPEEMTVTLRVILGEDQEFQRNPVAITFPGAGRRQFLGAMPSEGDHCIIGHFAQESSGGTRTPVILSWLVPGVPMGHDWMTTQPFEQDEIAMNPKNSQFMAGAFERVRHKLRHMQPGDIVASSSQGADLVLDQDARLANRGCNEILIRDADDAIVTRSQQHYQVNSGVRVYSGMVQRDATFLPTHLFSDGVDWTGPRQVNPDTENPYTDAEMTEFLSDLTAGLLNPHPVFSHAGDNAVIGDVPTSGMQFEPNVDPYYVLERGLFVNSAGFAFDDLVEPDAVYGGKPIHRVSIQADDEGKPFNALLSKGEQARTLTEYRVEVAHTTDSVLPVSEQTEMFDAERLPLAAQTDADARGSSLNSPYVEWVLGNVVGNDPFTVTGRKVYGFPLTANLFDATGAPFPEISSGQRVPLGEQMASLFRVTPPTLQGGSPTFLTTLKDGRVRFSVGGPQSDPYGLQGFSQSGIWLSTGGTFRVDAVNGFQFNVTGGDATNNHGFDLTSERGAVRIYGGGESRQGGLARNTAPTGGGDLDAPSVIVEGKNNVTVKASRKVLINANDIDLRGGSVRSAAASEFSVNAGDSIQLSAKTVNVTSNGKATFAYQGPRDALPTNGAFRSQTFTGIGVVPVGDYLVIQGDRTENFLIGNHTTRTLVGNLSYETLLGFWTARAGANFFYADAVSGLSATSTVGEITITAAAGGVSVTGTAQVGVRSFGPVVVSSTSVVTLGAPGKVGGIVVNTDLDPLTGLPLVTYGQGSPTHLLGPPT